MTDAPEPHLMAKELIPLFGAQGIEISYDYARALIRECPLSVRGRYIKFSDAWVWWAANADFRPFSRKRRRQHSLKLTA